MEGFPLLLIAIICIASSNCAELGEYICFGKPTDTLLPHPDECNAFFLCDGGVGYKNVCPDNSFFNPNRGVCDPNYTGCTSSGQTTSAAATTNGEWTPPTLQPTNSPTIDTTKTTTITIATLPPLRCPGEDTNNLTFLPSRERCDEFYLCYYGKPVPFQCSAGLHYSEQFSGCVPPDEAQCVINKPDSPFDVRCPKRGRRFIPYAKDCENFLYCNEGYQSLQRCQPFYHWDIQQKRCMLMTRAVCIQSIPTSMRRMYY